MADIKERIIIESVDNTTRGMRSAQNKLNAFDRTLKRVQTTMLGFVGINIATHMIQGITRMSDSAVELDAKLRLMTDSTEDFNYAQQELVKLSLESGSSLEANTILFTRMNKSIKSMGGNTQTTLDTTRALSQGLRISGASTQESDSVIRQWSQAMASGILRGEEFNAVSENGARIIQALSDSLGVNIGELRAMSNEGKLTAQIVTDALLKQSKVLQEENDKLPITMGRAIENVNTQYLLLLQNMSDANNSIAEGINILAGNFQLFASALATVVEVAIVYAGLKFAQHLKLQAIAMRESNIASKESARATKIEQQATQELIVTQLREQAMLTKIALVRKQHHVTATKQHISELKNTVQRLTLAEKELASKVRQLKWEIRSNTATQGNILARKQLIGLQHRSALSSGALRTATMSLAGAEQTLTRALVSQTIAYNANSIAQRKVSKAQISGLKKLTTGIKGFISKLASVDMLLSGFMGYEFGTWLYDNSDWVRKGGVLLNWVIQALIVGFQFLTEVVSAVFSDDTIGGAWDRYVERLKQVNEITADLYNSTNLKSGETKHKLIQDNNERVAHTLKALETINKAEKDHQKLIFAEIDRQANLRKIALGQRVTDQNEYDAKLKQLEQQTLEEKDQALVDNLAIQLGHYIKFYENREILQIEGDDRIKQHESDINDENDQLLLEILNDEHQRYANFRQLEINLEKAHNKQIQNLSKEKAQKLKEIANESLDALINSANRLVTAERNALARSKSVLIEYKEFVKEILGDQRADYVKLSDAQKKQREIEAKLREASKAEAEGNHQKATRLNEEALADAKELTRNYKEISETADEGSISQVKAHNAVKVALDLVKEATDGVHTSSEEMASTIHDQVEERKKDIETYTKLITELDKQLNSDRIISAKVDTEKVYNQLDAIDAKIKALSQDVVVNVKTTKSGGGEDSPVKRAVGGFIPRSNKVPGTGSGDKVKALLEPGEFIMRKSAVSKFGEGAMYALNRGDDIIRRASGGIIPGIQKFASGGNVSGSGQGVSDSSIDNVVERYMKLMNAYIARSQRPGSGFTQYMDNIASMNVVEIIKNLLKTMPLLKGKDPEKVRNIIDLGDKAVQNSISSATTYRGKGFSAYIKSAKTASDRAKLLNERDLWIQQLSLGGIIQRFAEGGNVLGSGLGDSVRALLTPGEFVMKKGAVQSFGTDFMNSINQGVIPQRFASGGIVGSGNGDVETINVNFNINGSQATGNFPRTDATMQLIDQLKSAEASS